MNEREQELANQAAKALEIWLNTPEEDVVYEWQRLWGLDPQEPFDEDATALLKLQSEMKACLEPLLKVQDAAELSGDAFRQAMKTLNQRGIWDLKKTLEIQYDFSEPDGKLVQFHLEPFAATREQTMWHRITQALRAKRLGLCLYCGRYFYKTRTDARFCRDSHRRMYHTREIRKREKAK